MTIIKYFKLILREKTLRAQAIALFSGNLSAAVNYIVSIVITRSLVPEEVAVSTAIMALPPILFSVFSFIPYVVASEVVAAERSPDLLTRKISNLFDVHLVMSLFWTAILIAGTPGISSLLKLNFPLMLGCLIISVFIRSQINFISGIAQGLEKFLVLGIKDLALAVIKLTCILLMLRWGYRTAWLPIVADVCSVLLVFIVLYFYFSAYVDLRRFSLAGFNSRIRTFAKGSLNSIVFVSFLGMMASFDILMAKVTFSDLEAGYFAATSTLAKSVFFIGSSTSIVMFVLVAKNSLTQNRWELFKSSALSILITLCVSAAMACGLFYFREALVNKIYGQKYFYMIPLLGPLLLYMLGLSLATVLMNFLMAVKARKALIGIALGYLLFSIYLIRLPLTVEAFGRALAVFEISILFYLLAAYVQNIWWHKKT